MMYLILRRNSFWVNLAHIFKILADENPEAFCKILHKRWYYHPSTTQFILQKEALLGYLKLSDIYLIQ